MNRKGRFRETRFGLLGIGLALALAIIGCQNGEPGLVTGVGVKPSAEGVKPPPPPPADPAIAYAATRRVQGQNVTSLKVMNADGTNATAIYTMTSSAVLMPSWSPDGASITFCDRPANTTGINLMRIDVSLVNGVPVGTNVTTLVDRTSMISESVWSPLGDQIAFWDWDLRTMEVIPAAGGSSEVLYTSIGSIHWSAWKRDGSQIIFSEREVSGGSALRAVDVAAPHTVTTLLGPEFSQQHGNADIRWPDYARGADVLAFECAGSVYTLDLAGGTPLLVVAGAAPAWSPNDATLLFTANGIFKVDLASGAVTDMHTAGGTPDWRRF